MVNEGLVGEGEELGSILVGFVKEICEYLVRKEGG